MKFSNIWGLQQIWQELDDAPWWLRRGTARLQMKEESHQQHEEPWSQNCKYVLPATCDSTLTDHNLEDLPTWWICVDTAKI